MVKDERLVVLVSGRELKALDCLAEMGRMNRSAIVRGLIPPLVIAEAMVDLQRLQGMSGRFAAEDFFTLFSLNVLAGWMRHDEKNPIEYQLDSACSGDSPELKVALLFQVWSRAKRNIRGHWFEQVFYENRIFHLVFGPGDTPEKVGALRAEILDYAKKLYAPLPPLFIDDKEI